MRNKYILETDHPAAAQNLPVNDEVFTHENMLEIVLHHIF